MASLALISIHSAYPKADIIDLTAAAFTAAKLMIRRVIQDTHPEFLEGNKQKLLGMTMALAEEINPPDRVH